MSRITGGKQYEMKLERQAAQITMVLINYCKKFGFILSMMGEKKGMMEHD